MRNSWRRLRLLFFVAPAGECKSFAQSYAFLRMQSQKNTVCDQQTTSEWRASLRRVLTAIPDLSPDEIRSNNK
jgi:hypothetical protein